jgi:hypothetical protein
MKTYEVFVNGCFIAILKAGSHNSAEKKATVKFGHLGNVSVAYTEAAQ